MVVYVDVLIFVNMVVNYLLVSLTTIILNIKVKSVNEILASFVGSLFSLYIFLPKQNLIIEILLRVIPAVVIVLMCYGFGNFKFFLRKTVVFYAVSFIYAGLMMGVWVLFKPDIMSINNGIIYFDISPLVLITLSLIFYILFYLLRKITNKNSESATRCSIKINYQDKSYGCSAIVDTGHSLTDVFGSSINFIVDSSVAVNLFGEEETARILSLTPPIDIKMQKNFRLIPTKTITGEKVMSGIKVDDVEIEFSSKIIKHSKPVAIISNEILGDDFSAILPTKALNEG